MQEVKATSSLIVLKALFKLPASTTVGEHAFISMIEVCCSCCIEESFNAVLNGLYRIETFNY